MKQEITEEQAEKIAKLGILTDYSIPRTIGKLIEWIMSKQNWLKRKDGTCMVLNFLEEQTRINGLGQLSLIDALVKLAIIIKKEEE